MNAGLLMMLLSMLGLEMPFDSVGMSFVEVASQWGLSISLAKTRGLAVGAEVDEDIPVRVQGGVIDIYLFGSQFIS